MDRDGKPQSRMRAICSAPVTAVRMLCRSFSRIFLAKMPLDDFPDYDDYWRKRGQARFMYRYKVIVDDLPDTGSILDIACGDGTFLEYVGRRRPGLERFGVDVSGVAIEKLKERGIAGDVCDLNKGGLPPDLRADYVTMMEVIEHIPEAEQVMRSLKTTGARRYYISMPNMGQIEHRLRLGLAGKMPLTTLIYHIKEHVRFWTVSDFKYWSDQMGYRIVKKCGQNGTPFLWRVWPSLFAMQMLYILEEKDPSRPD